jgi:phosphatidylglycerol:prolipoprotein diacylglycerol transferase
MHPILFRIGPFELYTYGALLAVAFLVAIFLATRQAERVGLTADFIADLGIVVILSAVVGSRLFHILFYDLHYTLEHPRELLRVRQTGMVFYGGLIFAVAAGMIFCRVKRAPIMRVLDVAAPSIAIGQAIGRIGCFMSGCCYGEPTWVPWAVTFPGREYPRHPTQIYESLATLGIFFILVRFRKRTTGDGKTAWLYVVLYAVVRFALEFLRGDNPQVLFGLTISQVISVLALAGAVPFGYFVWTRASRGNARTDGSGASRAPM